jgi:membrane complex biogenesis BtpA family protein
MLHLPRPLPGRLSAARPRRHRGACSDARILAGGFDAAVLENYGDVPFFKGRVDPVTVASMSRLAVAVRSEAGTLRLGINVLRNDAASALAVAFAAGADFIRVNVHVGATATDQGVIEGRAAETLRLRAALGADVAIWSDVHVKHGRSLAHPSIEERPRMPCSADSPTLSSCPDGRRASPLSRRGAASEGLDLGVRSTSGAALPRRT